MLESLIFALVFEAIAIAIGFLYEMHKQSKWSTNPILDSLDARKHALAIFAHLRQRAEALEWWGSSDTYTLCKYAKDELKAGDTRELEILIAQFHMLGCTIDIVPVDQLPEEIPGERIVINPQRGDK